MIFAHRNKKYVRIEQIETLSVVCACACICVRVCGCVKQQNLCVLPVPEFQWCVEFQWVDTHRIQWSSQYSRRLVVSEADDIPALSLSDGEEDTINAVFPLFSAAGSPPHHASHLQASLAPPPPGSQQLLQMSYKSSPCATEPTSTLEPYRSTYAHTNVRQWFCKN